MIFSSTSKYIVCEHFKVWLRIFPIQKNIEISIWGDFSRSNDTNDTSARYSIILGFGSRSILIFTLNFQVFLLSKRR